MVLSPESQKAVACFAEVRRIYEIHDHHHAVAILVHDYADLFLELCQVLLEFKLTKAQIIKAGGNESEIPKAFATVLRPKGWQEKKLVAAVVVDGETVLRDTHKVDFVRGQVAFDLEWNSKDQTFDRDLYAFRAFFDYGKIAVAILVTRSDDLDPYFRELGSYVDRYGTSRRYEAKYGASTTHMGKLLPRLEAGRGGGCPILAIGITRKQLEETSGQDIQTP